MLALKNRHVSLNGEELARYLALLCRRQPRDLVAIAATQNNAVETAVVEGNLPLALDAVAARGIALPPVWTKAYTALAGLYYASASPRVRSAFTGALGTGTIGERIGKPVDRTQQLAGDGWFYYGSRYGEYLAALGLPGSDDYLPSGEEATPGRSGAYFDLAEYYRGAHDPKRALSEYEYALQLDPDRADAHARMAAIEWDHGRRHDALAAWTKAVAAFERLEDRRSLSPQFWTDVRQMLEDVGARGALPPLRADADKLLRTYLRRNGAYRVDPLFEGALAAAGSAQAGVAWIVDLSGAAADPVDLLGHIVDASWLPEAERGAVYQKLVAAAGARLTQIYGDARTDAQSGLARWQLAWLRYLVNREEIPQAQALMARIPVETRRSMAGEFVPLQIRVA
ncbi:MAG: tetratricopeptide repeat protein, partial [Bryobacteraceae bacterium]